MREIDIVITEGLFKPYWWAPKTWPKERRRVWSIEVLGYGCTQAIRKEDIYLMACEYAAGMEDKDVNEYKVRLARWTNRGA